MRLSNRKKGASVDMQMTSMIDVTFLLLIFFMTTSGFTVAERELDPGIKTDKPAANRPSAVEPVIVDIAKSGSRFVFKLGGRELDSLEELTRVLRRLENKGNPATVRTTDDSPFDKAAAAIQACKDAGFHNVQYVPRGQ
jgi:biopolymer transport protein ExbD